MNDVDDIYVEHFGVKGMKWGQRNTKNFKKKIHPPKLTKVQKQALKSGAIAGASAGALLLGVEVASRILIKGGKFPLSSANKDFIDVGSRVVKTVFDKRMLATPAKMLMA